MVGRVSSERRVTHPSFIPSVTRRGGGGGVDAERLRKTRGKGQVEDTNDEDEGMADGLKGLREGMILPVEQEACCAVL